MYGKNIRTEITARILLVLLTMNVVSPTIHFAFADSTQYYVDVDGGNDTNDGLTPGTAWQTLARVSSESLLQGDTVSFDCNDTWTGGLTLTSLPGSAGLPITINSFGGCGASRATIDTLSINTSTYIIVDGISISSSSAGAVGSISNSSDITLQNTLLSNAIGACIDISNSTGTLVSGNTISSCAYGLSMTNADGTISTNTFSNITEDAITVSSSRSLNITQNRLSNISESAIIYGSDTHISQNDITSSCTTSTTECAAIKNNPLLSGTITSTITQNRIKDIGTGVTGSENSGILTEGVDGVNLSNNAIQNAEHALRIVDASNMSATGNTLLLSRKNSLSVIQNIGGATSSNEFNENTILQRAPDYPYIEIRDETAGTGVAPELISADANTIFPNYQPNTSYARMVKFGGETGEYDKADLATWDVNISLFQYFAYKSYTNTGSFATANLLTNGTLDTNTLGWSTNALTGSAPTLTHNAVSSYSGGSMTVTPLGGSADRLWTTNSASLSVSTGQTYLVTGYAKSATGNLNLRAFFHSSGDINTLYTDRIAETYASASGRTFSFYLVANTTAADGTVTFETSSNDIAYEIDELSVRRVTGVIKNTNANEVLAFSNTGAVAYDQACPGGVQCFAYVDGINVPINWPTSIPAYTTRFVLWNNSPNIINTPSCTLNLSAGSVPTGQPVDVMWSTTNSDAQVLSYSTYTGSFSYAVANSGMVSIIPPYDTISTITLDAENQVGPNQCSVQVTTTNTAPNIYVTTITGSEDAIEITGTLSGEDLNPGDTVFFESFDPPSNGSINIESSGSIQYYPNADFCGTDTFMFRASDQYGHYADPISQPIDVTCTNDAPSAVDDIFSSNGYPTTLGVLANETDPDSIYVAQTFSIVSFTQPTDGVVTQSGETLIYTANDPITFSGTEIFQYRMQDQDSALSTNTGTVTINVVPNNIPPVTIDLTGSVNEDTILSDTLTGSDANGHPLTFLLEVNAGSGNVSVLPGGSYTYTPNLDFNGTDSFTYKANDGMIDSNISAVTITVNPVNDAPVTNNDSYALNQDTTMWVPVMNNDTDVDSTILSITGLTSPSNGTAVINGTGVDYTPTALYAGPDSFTYQIVDDMGLVSNTATVSMNVVSTNSPPTANPATFSVNEDSTLSGNVTGTDPELSTLTFTLGAGTSNGVLNLNNDGSFTYTPNPNYNGADSFTFQVNDGSYTSAPALATININPVNDRPTANTGAYTAIGNTASNNGNILTGALSGNDIDGDSLSFTVSTLPVNGTFSLTSTGYFTYTPALGYTGADSFVFRVSDGILSATGLINITVQDNGSVPILHHFDIIGPVTAYMNSAFGVTIQARDIGNALVSSYTGSVVFSSTNSGATLPNNGAQIPFFLSDGGVKTFGSGVIFTATGTFTLTVTDTVTSESGTLIVNVLANSGSGSGSGGGSGGGSSGGSSTASSVGPGAGSAGVSQNFPSFAMTPPTETELQSAPSISNTPIFVVANDPTGLLSQLFFSQRYLNNGVSSTSTGVPIRTIENISDIRAEKSLERIVDLLDEVDYSDPKSTIMMRAIIRSYLSAISYDEDAEMLYEYGRMKLENLELPLENIQAQSVRDALIRFLEREYRRYREMLDRNTMSRTEEDGLESATSEPGLDPNLDGTDELEIGGDEPEIEEGEPEIEEDFDIEVFLSNLSDEELDEENF